MRLSNVFTKTKHQVPKGEVAKNAQLLIQAGYIHKEMAGAYSYLPLGVKVLDKVTQIIREEMNAVGAQEVLLTALQRAEAWQKSNRWDDKVVDNWFKTRLKDGKELGLATTHEEPLTSLLTEYIHSYKDLPQYVYQFQTKFRNELRAKSGLLRGREFMMKDLYSFSIDQAAHEHFYEQMKTAYAKVYQRLGLGDRTYICFASGESFSKYSHEFQTICAAGEDTIYLDRKKKIAVNKEVYSESVIKDLGLSKAALEEVRAAEVGNIFSLGTKFSDALGLSYTNKQGKSQSVIMGCYGIGVSRAIGVITEVYADDKGLVWPISVAPAQAQIVPLGNSQEVMEEAELQYKKLQEQQLDVILDDRDLSPGEKLNDADLMGMPIRIVVSEHTLAKHSLEVKARTASQHSLVKTDKISVALKTLLK